MEIVSIMIRLAVYTLLYIHSIFHDFFIRFFQSAKVQRFSHVGNHHFTAYHIPHIWYMNQKRLTPNAENVTTKVMFNSY